MDNALDGRVDTGSQINSQTQVKISAKLVDKHMIDLGLEPQHVLDVDDDIKRKLVPKAYQ